MSYADILRNAYLSGKRFMVYDEKNGKILADGFLDLDAARAVKTCMIDEERQKAENIDHCVYWNIYSYQKTA